MRWEIDDVLGGRNRATSKPRDPNASLVGMLRDLSMPGSTMQILDEVIERRRVADLLHCQRIGGLIVDDGCQALNLRIVGLLCLWARGMAGPEQVLDVPRHDLEHEQLRSAR
jgi:hypothetical protein